MREPFSPLRRPLLVLWAALPLAAILAAGQAPAGTADAAARGRQQFTGAIPFQNGGAACASCHEAAGLPFPNGGTLGPNLSASYKRIGPLGFQIALRTLYFPAMAPIYRDHQLTAAEQADLMAFFAADARGPAAAAATPRIVAIAIAGCVVLFLLTAFAWRDRLRGVRGRLVASARGRARGAGGLR